ncbi:MAG: alpha-xenorhabdolysin family binary toxin subunit A [Pseudomonas sp.]
MQILNNKAPDMNTLPADKIGEQVYNFMLSAAGKHPDVERKPGLLVTNQDIRAIKSYVSAAMKLPTEGSEVVKYLGYDKSTVSGLDASQIVLFHQLVKNHANGWFQLEEKMRSVGSDLHVFSGNFEVVMTTVINFIKSLGSYNEALSRISDVSAEDLNSSPSISLIEGEEKKLPVLLDLINELKLLINDYKQSTTLVKFDITTFKHDLGVRVLPDVENKLKLVKDSNTDARRRDVLAQIEGLKVQIQEKTQVYESYSTRQWLGFWWGPIGGVISISIYGPKANSAYRDIQRLSAEKDRLGNEVKTLDTLTGALITLETSLVNLESRMAGALSGAENLEGLWSLLKGLVESSYKQIETSNDAMWLVIIVSRFEVMVKNWRDIKPLANELLTAFDSAVSSRN